MKNYKTTLTGILLAICYAVKPILEKGELSLQDIIISVLIAVMGYFTKDAGVTGKAI
ncbi:MAG TPA: hypothetical protein VGB63_12975 [Pedobacter sp.]|jgi:hypothetical protein